MGTLTIASILKDGRPWPLGAHWDGAGVNFALFSANAERVDLCTFAGETMQTHPLTKHTDQVWHGYLPDATPGLCYAFRVYGPASPGHRFDPTRLLIDPYARELTGVFSYEHTSSATNGLSAPSSARFSGFTAFCPLCAIAPMTGSAFCIISEAGS